MGNIFRRFETSSRAEREEMADNLKAHYNHMIQLEREAFAALPRKGHNPGLIFRNSGHSEIMAALGHVQAVFDILGIDYEPGQPFDLDFEAVRE